MKRLLCAFGIIMCLFFAGCEKNKPTATEEALGVIESSDVERSETVESDIQSDSDADKENK